MSIVLLRDLPGHHTFLLWAPDPLLDRISYYNSIVYLCFNSPKCQELGWACTPLAVETYGNWGEVAQGTYSRLASRLAVSQSRPKAVVVAGIYDSIAR